MNKDKIISYIDNLDLDDKEKEEVLIYAESLIKKFDHFSVSLNAMKNNEEISKSIIDIIKTLTKEHSNVKRDA